ncbi:uncharacterized protein UTRI_10489_B [Ustilago trichophora]|uniref:RNase III domain-containing protein n=1 Tax=Ustilago trichophora TaxID=86804 RepID=A0A5C3E9A7_9BASI|nr:uncharacterized protein UTRI_10489_B [Ustilago trichophora]
MSLPYAASAVRFSWRSVLPASMTYRATPSTSRVVASRCLASSSRSDARVQHEASQEVHPSSGPDTFTDEAPKLGKRARKALKARQRQEEDRVAKEAKAKAKAEARAHETVSSSFDHSSSEAMSAHAPPILKVKHVLDAADGASASTKAQQQELNRWRSQTQAGDGTNPTAGWSGSLFRSHISSLLSGFGTAPESRPLQEADFASSRAVEEQSAPSTSYTSDMGASGKAAHKKVHSLTSPAMTKSERMESQARVIFHAIREARERGIVDEDESFFYPYPEGVPPKDIEGKDAVWLNLGPDPEAWGKEIPQVKDKWLEVLCLGLTKEISGRPLTRYSTAKLGEVEGASKSELRQRDGNGFALDELVEDYDLEDHERLEQLGDSIVNMSSRLLAYLSYPDVNEGSLTRLSNYPTQNNFLALLFQECGLAARRDELRRELRKAQNPENEMDGDAEADSSKRTKVGNAAETDEEKARLPLLIKRDADMFEAYAAAVFLSNGNDFNVVHEWLCHLFRPFQDQAYRFMVQRSEALARLQANRAAAAAAAAASAAASASLNTPSGNGTASATNLAADGLGIKSASVDPSSVPFSSLFPDFARGSSDKTSPTGIPTYALNNTSEAFITDEFLTVAARARRQREERLREELRVQDQQELMNMGWFRKGFLNLRQGFRQYVMGKDIVKEEEARIRQKVDEQRGMSERDRQRLRARERIAAGVSIRSTGSKQREKVVEGVERE